MSIHSKNISIGSWSNKGSGCKMAVVLEGAGQNSHVHPYRVFMAGERWTIVKHNVWKDINYQKRINFFFLRRYRLLPKRVDNFTVFGSKDGIKF